MDITLTWRELTGQSTPAWHSHHSGHNNSTCQVHQRDAERWIGFVAFSSRNQLSFPEAQAWCEQEALPVARRLFAIPEPISLEWDAERLDLWTAIIAGFKPILTPIRCSVFDEQPNGFRALVRYSSRNIPLHSLAEAQTWCAREVLFNEQAQK